MITYRFLILSPWLLLFLFSCKKSTSDHNNDNNPADKQLREGLIAYYPFNNNANDESGNEYHLTVKGAVLTDDRFGEPAKAYRFDGTTSFMTLPKLLKADSLRDLTISVWVKTEALQHSSILSFFSKGSRFFCTSYLGFENHDSDYKTWHQMVTDLGSNTCSAAIIKDSIENPLNKWSHVVLVQRYYSENTAIPRYNYFQYFNGKKLKPATSTIGTAPVATSFSSGGVIGCNNTTANYDFNFDYFKGSIDDIRIYNRALSDEEVAQLYNLHY